MPVYVGLVVQQMQPPVCTIASSRCCQFTLPSLCSGGPAARAADPEKPSHNDAASGAAGLDRRRSRTRLGGRLHAALPFRPIARGAAEWQPRMQNDGARDGGDRGAAARRSRLRAPGPGRTTYSRIDLRGLAY